VNGVWVQLASGGPLAQFSTANSALTFDDVRTIAGGPGGQALAGFTAQGVPGATNNPPALNYLTLNEGSPASASIAAYSFNLTNEIVQANHAVYDPLRDQFWIGTNEGVSLLDSSFDVIEHRHPVHPHGFSNGVAITPGGNVWDGDEFQLSQLNAGPQADFAATFDPVVQPFPLVQQNCSSVSLDASGNVWVGSESQGLALLNPNALTSQLWDQSSGLPSLAVQAVAVEPDGSVWVGTLDRGLGRLTPDGGTWQTYRATSGLLSDEVRSLFVVAGYPRLLVLTTGAGVFTYDGP
jgi:ligand-binding sensor domain-containing protein